jgi:hypothetical protein
MTHRKSRQAQAFGLALVLLAPSTLAQTQAPTPRPPVRVYTNADLERVHPYVAETGVRSVAPETAVEPKAERARNGRRTIRGEAWWRDEAARVRERVRALEERAAQLRARIAERASQSEVFGRRRASSGRESLATLEASLAAVERRARQLQDDLEERARREGALPGWLR